MKTQLYIVLILLFSSTSQIYSQDFWEQVYFPDSLNVKNITFDNQQRILIGTSTGIFRSIENDINWVLLGLSHRIIHSVAVNNNGDIYAGTSQAPDFSQGLYRSIDNGVTWEEVLPDIGVYGEVMKILPLGDTIFASLWMGGARLIRTTDNCQTWDLVFATENTSEYISDVLISSGGEMYISLKAYMEDMGGVYKSSDWGDTWEYSGLFNNQVSCLAKNSSDDIFAGSWGALDSDGMKGLYVLRNGQTQWDPLALGSQVDDVVVNSDEDIFISIASPSAAILRSQDNGETFEVINAGLPVGSGMGDMEINDEGFIYVTSSFLSNYLAKSIITTVSLPEIIMSSKNNCYSVFPNPVKDLLNIRSNCNCSSADEVTLKIINGWGKLVFSTKTNSINSFTQLNLNHLAKGAYLLEISDCKTNSYLKIIKQ